MSEDLLQKTRDLLATLLGKPTDGLGLDQLRSLIQEGIAEQIAMRKSTGGGGCTLTLNTLLALDGQRL